MHQRGTNTGTKSKLLSGGKLLCSHAGKLSPKSGAEGSCLAPASAVLERGHRLSLGKVMSFVFGCQTPAKVAPFQTHTILILQTLPAVAPPHFGCIRLALQCFCHVHV